MGAIALSMVATSCNHVRIEKDEPVNQPVKVTFNVSALDVITQSMTKSGNAKNASAGLGKLFYYITGSTTETGTQISTDTGFGTIDLMLTPGTYDAYFIGTPDATQNIDFYYHYNGTSVTFGDADMFAKSLQLTIADAQSFDVTMNRLTGQLVVDLTDTDVPSNVKSVKVTCTRRDCWSFTWCSATDNVSVEKVIQPENGQFPDCIVNSFPIDDKTATITILDADNNVLGETSVDYNIVANQRTIIRGSIFDIIETNRLTIKYDDEWGNDNVVTLE